MMTCMATANIAQCTVSRSVCTLPRARCSLVIHSQRRAGVMGTMRLANRQGRGCVRLVRAVQQEKEQKDEAGEPKVGSKEWYNRNIGEYCSLDEAGAQARERSLGEMEQEFLAALSSWYYEGKPLMSDEEFQNLKEELLWNGSKVAILSSKEQRFMEASLAYQRGTPILSDEEYDQLKGELRKRNSVVTVQGPRCSIRTKNLYSDAAPDYLKMTLLNLPAAVLVLAAVFTLDDVTGFQITRSVELPAPFGVLTLWGILLPLVYVLATSLTNLVLKDGVILKADCPNCGAPNTTYFGSIFSVDGNKGRNASECGQCKSSLTFDSAKRIVVCTAGPPSPEASKPKPKPKPKAAAKKDGE